MRKPIVRTFVVLVALGSGVTGVACGLEDGGVLTVEGTDSSLQPDRSVVVDGNLLPDTNGPTDANDPPDTAEAAPPCATVDAACLDANVPDGWALTGFAANGNACPSGFSPTSLVVDPKLANGACTCAGCQTQGSYSCGQATVHAGNNCGNNVQVDSGDCTNDPHTSISAEAPKISGSPTCTNASDAGNFQATTTPATACSPTSCTADYCALPKAGFQRCIVADGVVPCPAGFKTKVSAGTGATVACDLCGCSVNAASCSGKIEAFPNNDCMGNPSTYTADNACQTPGFSSYKYLANATPTPSCTPSMPSQGTGTATLTGPKTVCCQ